MIHAAFCPQPPVIVPEGAGRAAGELDAMRTAADTAVRELLAFPVDRIVVIGGQDPGPAQAPAAVTIPAGTVPAATVPAWPVYRPPVRASFRPYGIPVDVDLPARSTRAATGAAAPTRSAAARSGRRLPLSLTVAAWLLARNGFDGARRTIELVAVPDSASAADCRRFGQHLAADTTAWAALVMGDGSACRGAAAPGYHDERAEPFDDRVGAALAGADHRALAALDPQVAAELRVAGRAAWQVAAGAAAGWAAGAAAGWAGRLHWYAAPYGVAYFVASWQHT